MLEGRKSAIPLLLIAAGGLVVGLAVPAAARETSHLINGKSIAIQSIPGNRLKVNTLTGRQIKESTLGTVPKATLARKLPALVWHPITTFENGWTNFGDSTYPAAYALDAQGTVQLRGAVAGGTEGEIAFTLPASLVNPSFTDLPVQGNEGMGYLQTFAGGNVEIKSQPGATSDMSTYTELSGVTFSSTPVPPTTLSLKAHHLPRDGAAVGR